MRESRVVAHPAYRWTLDPSVLAAVAIGAYFYVRRFRQARAEAGGRGAGLREAACFAAAVIVVLIALISPVDYVGEHYLFSVHMFQHLLLGDIAPLLLLLSLSRVIMRPVTRRLTGIERRLGVLASPISCIAVWVAILYLWHVPALYDAALRNPAVHAFEHLCFFAGGLCVWWPLIQPVPMRRRLTGLATFGYMFAAKVAAGALGIFLTWSTVVAYGYYEHVPRIWGLSVINDQNAGGAVMMVEQSVVLAVVLAVLLVRMLAASEEEERRRERLEDAALAAEVNAA